MRLTLSLLYVILILPVGAAAQASLKCELDVRILPRLLREEVLDGRRDTLNMSRISLYPHPVNVTQKLTLTDYPFDTLVMYLTNRSYLQSFNEAFYQRLSVSAFSEGDSTSITDYSFDGERLEIPLPKKNGEIKIGYAYQPDFMFRISSGASNYFVQYNCTQQSWHFTCPSMTVRDIRFDFPENETWLFVSSRKSNGNANGPDFYLLSRPYYDTAKIYTDSLDITLYYNKGVRTDTVSEHRNGSEVLVKKILPGHRNIRELNDSICRTLPSKVKFLLEIFGRTETPPLHIADAGLWKEDMEGNRFAWGLTDKCGDTAFLIAVDTSMFYDHSLLHEIIHTFMDASKFGEQDYFLSESLVEYLAVYTAYSDPALRDSVFRKKLTAYNQYAGKAVEAQLSIFSLKDNAAYLDGNGGGSFMTVYQKAPYLIHRLARTMGEENFVVLLKKFYREARDKDTLGFPDFERLVAESGMITEKEWKEFLLSL